MLPEEGPHFSAKGLMTPGSPCAKVTQMAHTVEIKRGRIFIASEKVSHEETMPKNAEDMWRLRAFYPRRSIAGWMKVRHDVVGLRLVVLDAEIIATLLRTRSFEEELVSPAGSEEGKDLPRRRRFSLFNRHRIGQCVVPGEDVEYRRRWRLGM
jgi:hypothetical protein